MNQPNDPGVRVGDAEREAAVSALGEHMSSGRLTVDEYGQRSARVTAAKTRGEVAEMFSDLPAPHPTFGSPAAAPEPAAAPQAPAPSRGTQLARFAPALIPIAAVAAVAVFMATHLGAVFLVIPLVVLVTGGGRRWGGHRHGHCGRMERRMDRFGRRYR